MQEVHRICSALQSNTTLTELSSSGHEMQPDTAKLVAQMLSLNTALTSLCVGDRNFGDKALQELASGLQNNASLQKLDLEQRSITAEGIRALSQALNGSSGVRQLILSRNRLGNTGKGPSCILLESSTAAIGKPCLALMKMQLLVAVRCLMTFAYKHRQLTRQTFYVSFACYATAGAEVLAPTLQHLEEANLTDCEISAEGATALAVALAAPSSRLRCLRLQRNAIGEEGTEAIASAAAASPCLEELYLGECGIGDAGSIQLRSSMNSACTPVSADAEIARQLVQSHDSGHHQKQALFMDSCQYERQVCKFGYANLECYLTQGQDISFLSKCLQHPIQLGE